MMMDEGLNIEWTSLSRADTLDAEALNAMKRAGCKRIYVGIESGSQKVLDYYKKGYRAEKIKERVDLIKKAGIEAVGFFIVGSEVEGPRELNESIDLAKRTDFDYIIVTKLTPYPGTPLFETVRDKMDFTLFPYKNEFRDAGWEEEMIKREKKFYRTFYFRFKYAVSKLSEFFRRPVSFMADIFKLASFVLSGNRNKKDHGDYL
jgi:radical SAM superfamily enzyme YgiQ (UPF0313 family)